MDQGLIAGIDIADDLRVESAGASTEESMDTSAAPREHPIALDNGGAVMFIDFVDGNLLSRISAAVAEGMANGGGATTDDVVNAIVEESMKSSQHSAVGGGGGAGGVPCPITSDACQHAATVTTPTPCVASPHADVVETLTNGAAAGDIGVAHGHSMHLAAGRGTALSTPGSSELALSNGYTGKLEADFTPEMAPGEGDFIAPTFLNCDGPTADVPVSLALSKPDASSSEVPAAIQTVVLSNNGFEQQQSAGGLLIVTSANPQTTFTVQWLFNHFEAAEHMSLPRHIIFTFYSEYCRQANMQPVNSASFGKAMRQVFPNVKTRRLGTRGQSRYHYYGVGVRPISPYHAAMEIALKAQTPDGGSMPLCAKLEAQEPVQEGHVTVQPAAPAGLATSASLVGFPDVSTFLVPADVSSDKVTLVLVLYKAHCHRILDSVVAENFTEVESYITNFWGGLPDNLRVVLAHQLVIDLIGVCDFILYKAILGAVVPDALQQISLSATQSIRNFSSAIVTWISSALEQFPESVRERKLEVAVLFSAALKRRTSVSHLAQATRSVLQSQDSVVQMLSDWRQLHKSSIVYQSLSCCVTKDEVTTSIPLYLDFMAEFENLMIQQADVESFAFWLTTVVQRTVPQDVCALGSRRYLSSVMRSFMMKWQLMASCVVRDLTLHSAESFGSHHLLSMLFEDYLLHLLETKLFELREFELLSSIDKFAAPVDDGAVSPASSAVPTACDVSAPSTPTVDGGGGGGGVVVLQASLGAVLQDASNIDLPASRALTAEQLLRTCIAAAGSRVSDVSASLSATPAHTPPLANGSPAAAGPTVVRLSAPLSVAAQIPNAAALEDAAALVAALCDNEPAAAHAQVPTVRNGGYGTGGGSSAAACAFAAAAKSASSVAVDTVMLSDLQCAVAHAAEFSFSDVSGHAVGLETEVVLSNHQ